MTKNTNRECSKGKDRTILSPRSGWFGFLLTMVVSAMPVALAVGFGFYDFFVKDIDDTQALIVIPIVFSPLFLGAKLGLNSMRLFWGCVFWMAVLVTTILMR